MDFNEIKLDLKEILFLTSTLKSEDLAMNNLNYF